MTKSERNKLALFISDLMIPDQQQLVSPDEIASDLRELFDIEYELTSFGEVNKIEFIVRSIATMFSLRCSPLVFTHDKMLAVLLVLCVVALVWTGAYHWFPFEVKVR